MERDLDDYATKNPSSETSDIPNSKNIDNPQIKFSLSDKWNRNRRNICHNIFIPLCTVSIYGNF